MNKTLRSSVVVIICTAAIAGGVYFGVIREPSIDYTVAVGHAYFLDTGTGRIFTAIDDNTPIEAPGGPAADGSAAGYRLTLFACDEAGAQGPDLNGRSLADLEDLRIVAGYVEIYSPEALAARSRIREGTLSEMDPEVARLDGVIARGRLVAPIPDIEPPFAPSDFQWTPADSAAGFDMMQPSDGFCDGRMGRELTPAR